MSVIFGGRRCVSVEEPSYSVLPCSSFVLVVFSFLVGSSGLFRLVPLWLLSSGDFPVPGFFLSALFISRPGGCFGYAKKTLSFCIVID